MPVVRACVCACVCAGVRAGGRAWVCVCVRVIDVKLHFTAGGHRGPRGSVANEDTPWLPVKTYLLYIVPPLGAYKTQLGGHIFYRCCFIWSLSTMIIRLYTSSTAQGGGGSFKNRKPIGEVGCCESGMAEWILMERKVIDLSHPFSLFLWLSTYLPISLLCIYLSIDLYIKDHTLQRPDWESSWKFKVMFALSHMEWATSLLLCILYIQTRLERQFSIIQANNNDLSAPLLKHFLFWQARCFETFLQIPVHPDAVSSFSRCFLFLSFLSFFSSKNAAWHLKKKANLFALECLAGCSAQKKDIPGEHYFAAALCCCHPIGMNAT